jgi:hypothetical protein
LSDTFDEGLTRRLDAIDTDIRVALAFSRAAMVGLAALSAQARQAVDHALSEDAALIGYDGARGGGAGAIIAEARDGLRGRGQHGEPASDE